MFFSTDAREHEIVSAINLVRATEFFFDFDRTALGLAIPKQPQKTCILKIYASTSDRFHNYELNCNCLSWSHPIKKLKSHVAYQLVQKNEHPWHSLQRINDIEQNYIMDFEKAKEIVSFTDRMKHRIYDLTFAAFIQQTSQRVAVKDMRETLDIYTQWLATTEQGMKAWATAHEICKKTMKE